MSLKVRSTQTLGDIDLLFWPLRHYHTLPARGRSGCISTNNFSKVLRSL